jgi:hypothetical protein
MIAVCATRYVDTSHRFELRAAAKQLIDALEANRQLVRGD